MKGESKEMLPPFVLLEALGPQIHFALRRRLLGLGQKGGSVNHFRTTKAGEHCRGQ